VTIEESATRLSKLPATGSVIAGCLELAYAGQPGDLLLTGILRIS
jgi:hypothetical protein